MLKDHREILLKLNAHDVKYLVIGGHAVGIHAEPRGTKDLDIFIKADEENSKAVFAALADFGAPLRNMTPADFNDKPTSVFQMGVPPARIDILQGIAGVSFDEAWDARVEGFLDKDTPGHIISRQHLIQNKLASGRHQDLADVDALRESATAQLPPNPYRPKKAPRRIK
jgi:hypothetical protein